MSKENILKHLDENWQKLVDSISGLSEADLLKPDVCGTWSVRDILGHISTWEEEAMQNIPFILTGESTPRYAATGGIEAFNARSQQDKKELTLPRIKREFYATHQRFMNYLSSIPKSNFENNSRLAKRIRLDGYAHYVEHAEQIETWRKQT
jgi:hypothetical protein